MTRRASNVCFFIGTHGDWGGASRIIFNIVRKLDRTWFNPMVMLTAEGAICQELNELEVPYRIWPLENDYRPIAYARHFLKSLRFLSRENINLVVLSYGCLGWRPAELLAAKVLRIPIIEHCQRVQKIPYPYGRFAARVFASSKYICERSNLPGINMAPLYDLVDAERFATGRDIRSELGIPAKDRLVTYLGRKRKSKGIDLFVELARRISDPDVSFIIASQRTGRPNEDTYSETEFAKLIAADDRIRHVGFRDDVESIYRTSDIIVMPSIAPEPCPAVAIEAAASGRPIVATNTGATPEFVENGITGLLVSEMDLDGLLHAVQDLLDDPEKRSKLGENARAFALQKFVAEPIATINETYAGVAGR